MTTEKKQNLEFKDIGIHAYILNVLKKLNIETPTPIQKKAIPAAINGQDLIGVAQTGTGKTFAFGIPMIQRLMQNKKKGLIILPTRELALQVEENLRKLSWRLGFKTISLIGGISMSWQIRDLKRNPRIIVATPGRLIDHLKRKTAKLDDVGILVLDEADMMFDMGFAPQLEEILKDVPKERQTMLFSATIPATIIKLATNHMKMPVHIEVAPTGTTAEKVDQEVYVMHKDDKFIYLEKVLKEYNGQVLVFSRTKIGARQITKNLQIKGQRAVEIHSNLSFRERRRSLDGFKSKKYRILVATDIAARGIDVSGIELVVNYDLPDASEDYVHRIGRTGRAGKAGKAISFATPKQWKEINNIERLIKKNLPLKKYAELEKPMLKPINSRFKRKSKFSKYKSQAGFQKNSFQSGNRKSSSGYHSFKKKTSLYN